MKQVEQEFERLNTKCQELTEKLDKLTTEHGLKELQKEIRSYKSDIKKYERSIIEEFLKPSVKDHGQSADSDS